RVANEGFIETAAHITDNKLTDLGLIAAGPDGRLRGFKEKGNFNQVLDLALNGSGLVIRNAFLIAFKNHALRRIFEALSVPCASNERTHDTRMLREKYPFGLFATLGEGAFVNLEMIEQANGFLAQIKSLEAQHKTENENAIKSLKGKQQVLLPASWDSITEPEDRIQLWQIVHDLHNPETGLKFYVADLGIAECARPGEISGFWFDVGNPRSYIAAADFVAFDDGGRRYFGLPGIDRQLIDSHFPEEKVEFTDPEHVFAYNVTAEIGENACLRIGPKVKLSNTHIRVPDNTQIFIGIPSAKDGLAGVEFVPNWYIEESIFSPSEGKNLLLPALVERTTEERRCCAMVYGFLPEEEEADLVYGIKPAHANTLLVDRDHNQYLVAWPLCQDVKGMLKNPIPGTPGNFEHWRQRIIGISYLRENFSRLKTLSAEARRRQRAIHYEDVLRFHPERKLGVVLENIHSDTELVREAIHMVLSRRSDVMYDQLEELVGKAMLSFQEFTTFFINDFLRSEHKLHPAVSRFRLIQSAYSAYSILLEYVFDRTHRAQAKPLYFVIAGLPLIDRKRFGANDHTEMLYLTSNAVWPLLDNVITASLARPQTRNEVGMSLAVPLRSIANGVTQERGIFGMIELVEINSNAALSPQAQESLEAGLHLLGPEASSPAAVKKTINARFLKLRNGMVVRVAEDNVLQTDDIQGSSGQGIPGTESSEQVLWLQQRAGGFSVTARDDQGKLVGYLTALPELEKYSGLRGNKKTLYLLSVATDQCLVRKGLATALLSHFFELARAKGFTKVTLTIAGWRRGIWHLDALLMKKFSATISAKLPMFADPSSSSMNLTLAAVPAGQEDIEMVVNLKALDFAAINAGISWVAPAAASDTFFAKVINTNRALKIREIFLSARLADNLLVNLVAMEMPLNNLHGKRLTQVAGKGGGQGVYMKDLPWALRQEGVAACITTPIRLADIEHDYGTLDNFLIAFGGERLMNLEVPVGLGVIPLTVVYLEQEGVPVFGLIDESGNFFVELYNKPDPDSLGGYIEAIILPRAPYLIQDALGVQFDVLHFNDWQTALGPIFMKELYARHDWPLGRRPAAVFTTHNLEYQGLFPGFLAVKQNTKLMHYLCRNGVLNRAVNAQTVSVDLFALTNLPSALRDGIFNDGLEFWSIFPGGFVPGRHNLMKGAFLHADKIVFVSKGHMKEALTVKRGYGLDGVLNQMRDRLTYVYNGIRSAKHRPQNLAALRENGFRAEIGSNEFAWKETNKVALQDKVGLLWAQPIQFVIGIVTRIVKQKGLNVLFTPLEIDGRPLIEELLAMQDPSTGIHPQMVILGTAGDPRGEVVVRQLRKLVERKEYKTKLAFIEQFDPVLAKQIGAGVQVAIMPSIDEPGGIANQELALLLAPIVVTARGGLVDFYENKGTPIAPVPGFEIDDDPVSVEERMHSAREIYTRIEGLFEMYINRPREYARLLKDIRIFDPDWEPRIEEYKRIYQQSIDRISSSPVAVRDFYQQLAGIVVEQLDSEGISSFQDDTRVNVIVRAVIAQLQESLIRASARCQLNARIKGIGSIADPRELDIFEIIIPEENEIESLLPAAVFAVRERIHVLALAMILIVVSHEHSLLQKLVLSAQKEPLAEWMIVEGADALTYIEQNAYLPIALDTLRIVSGNHDETFETLVNSESLLGHIGFILWERASEGENGSIDQASASSPALPLNFPEIAETLDMLPSWIRNYGPLHRVSEFYGGHQFEPVELIGPNGEEHEIINEEQLRTLSRFWPVNRAVIVPNKAYMNYAADIIGRYLLGLANREVSLHLATGGTTEGWRKTHGLLGTWPHANGPEIDFEKVRWLCYWDDYAWPKDFFDQTIEFLGGHDPRYLAEHWRTIVGPWVTRGFPQDRLIGPLSRYEPTQITPYEIVQRFHAQLQEKIGSGEGKAPLLWAQAGVGSDLGHWGFNNNEEVNPVRGLLRPDCQTTIPFVIRVQNVWDFLKKSELPIPSIMLYWMNKYQAYTKTDFLKLFYKIVVTIEDRVVFSELNPRYPEITQEAERELGGLRELERWIEYCLEIYKRVPELTFTQGTGDLLLRNPYMVVTVANGRHKSFSIQAMFEKPNGRSTCSASQYANHIALITEDALTQATREKYGHMLFKFEPDAQNVNRAWSNENIDSYWQCAGFNRLQLPDVASTPLGAYVTTRGASSPGARSQIDMQRAMLMADLLETIEHDDAGALLSVFNTSLRGLEQQAEELFASLRLRVPVSYEQSAVIPEAEDIKSAGLLSFVHAFMQCVRPALPSEGDEWYLEQPAIRQEARRLLIEILRNVILNDFMSNRDEALLKALGTAEQWNAEHSVAFDDEIRILGKAAHDIARDAKLDELQQRLLQSALLLIKSRNLRLFVNNFAFQREPGSSPARHFTQAGRVQQRLGVASASSPTTVLLGGSSIVLFGRRVPFEADLFAQTRLALPDDFSSIVKLSLRLAEEGYINYDEVLTVERIQRQLIWGKQKVVFVVHAQQEAVWGFAYGYARGEQGLYFQLAVAKEKEGNGDVSQFGALSTALAATIGTGNIVGVATAIGMGGPGA
ncbi:MAG: GNAT family N-acetyltransferase, partial [Candidatus Omnitrophica bacterium]|nr:GNAT family N-acetyltransferase [Candidatus Omnitrophota bacterium]